MLSRICGPFHPLEPPLSEGVWAAVVKWRPRLEPSDECIFQHKWDYVNWCNKSSELSCDVLLKAVKGCPSNHVVQWVDIIKGVEWHYALLYGGHSGEHEGCIHSMSVGASVCSKVYGNCHFKEIKTPVTWSNLYKCCWSFGLFRLFSFSLQ